MALGTYLINENRLQAAAIRKRLKWEGSLLRWLASPGPLLTSEFTNRHPNSKRHGDEEEQVRARAEKERAPRIGFLPSARCAIDRLEKSQRTPRRPPK